MHLCWHLETTNEVAYVLDGAPNVDGNVVVAQVKLLHSVAQQPTEGPVLLLLRHIVIGISVLGQLGSQITLLARYRYSLVRSFTKNLSRRSMQLEHEVGAVPANLMT